MELFLSLALGKFTRSVGLPSVVTTQTLKARDTQQLDVKFHDGSALATMSPGLQLVFIIKDGVADSAGTLAMVDAWTEVAAGHYRARLSLNTAELIAAIGDAEKLPAYGELSWSAGDDEWQSSPTLSVRIDNDVYKGSEGTPDELPGPDDYVAARAVLYDRAQIGLTELQRAQARGNIGAPGLADVLPVEVWDEPGVEGDEIVPSGAGLFRVRSLSAVASYGSLYLAGGLSLVEYEDDSPGTPLAIHGTEPGVLAFLNGGDSAICWPDGAGSYRVAVFPALSGRLAAESLVALLAGNNTLTGQNTAPNQAAISPTSLMTRGLGDTRWYRPNLAREIPFDVWDSQAVANGGSTLLSTPLQLIRASCAPANSSMGMRYNSGFMPGFFAKPGDVSSNGIDWNKKHSWFFRVQIQGSSTIETTTTGYLRIGEYRLSTTFGPNTLKGVSLYLSNRVVVGMVHNGTMLTTGGTTLFDLSDGQFRVHHVEIRHTGGGVYEFRVNEVLMSTLAGGPNAAGSQEYTQIAPMIRNGPASTQAAYFDVIGQPVFTYHEP